MEPADTSGFSLTRPGRGSCRARSVTRRPAASTSGWKPSADERLPESAVRRKGVGASTDSRARPRGPPSRPTRRPSCRPGCSREPAGEVGVTLRRSPVGLRPAAIDHLSRGRPCAVPGAAALERPPSCIRSRCRRTPLMCRSKCRGQLLRRGRPPQLPELARTGAPGSAVRRPSAASGASMSGVLHSRAVESKGTRC